MAVGTPTSRRVKPSSLSLAVSLVLFSLSAALVILYSGFLLFLFVLPVALGTVAVVFLFRRRSVLDQAPPPEGRGRTRLVNSRQALLQGVAVLVLRAAVIFGPFILMAYFPGPDVIASVLGLVTGLTLSQPVFFAWVFRLERRARAEMYSVTGLTEEEGKQVLVKSIEMRRRDA